LDVVLIFLVKKKNVLFYCTKLKYTNYPISKVTQTLIQLIIVIHLIKQFNNIIIFFK